ncbi:MAG: ABC transporter substrate-binding protein [Desulfobacterales bacterium]|nr:ABC transporter substrate-binding protein [Desulfobacterales bacterium]
MASPGAGFADTGSAKAQLELSIEQILTVLRDPAFKAEGRQTAKREKIRQIARQRFDYRKMSQLSLGKHWKKRSDTEKDEFTDLFGTLLEDTYMAKIENYTDEDVVFLKERVQKKKAQVNTKIITDSVEIPINYRLYRKSEDTWMIYDMVIEGVSMIGNYRSQFGQMLERGSFQSLVEKLREKKE